MLPSLYTVLVGGIKKRKPVNACFCLNKHLDASVTMVLGVIWVYLTHFKGRAVLLQKNLKPLSASFRLKKNASMYQELWYEGLAGSLGHILKAGLFFQKEN